MTPDPREAEPLTLDEAEAWMRAPEDCIRAALEAKTQAEKAVAEGSPVAAREWFDVAAAAMRARNLFNPRVEG